MKRLLEAFRFLTVLPVPGQASMDTAVIGGSATFFPVVGAMIGALIALAAWGLASVFPPPIVAMMLTVGMVAISGGLHMDGLSDMADGFFSSRPRDRVLEIMKDSRIGAMGVIALVSVLGLKVMALLSLPDSDWLWRAALLAPLAGRCVMLMAMTICPAASPGQGLGSVFIASRKWPEAVWAMVVAGIVAFVLMSWAGLIAISVSIIVAGACAAWSWRKLGGITGDILGACCELAEAAVLVTLACRPVWELGR